MIKEITEYLDSEEFYELMQVYRHLSPLSQASVIRAFDDVKQGIIKAVARNNYNENNIKQTNH